MTSYHMPSTGSQRSVGPRRIRKIYTDDAGIQACARSAAEACRYGLSGVFEGLPTPAPAGTLSGPIAGAPAGHGPAVHQRPAATGGGGTQHAVNPLDLTATNHAAAAAADFAALAGPPAVHAVPGGHAWATGEFVTLADGSKAYWDGTAWQTGAAP